MKTDDDVSFQVGAFLFSVMALNISNAGMVQAESDPDSSALSEAERSALDEGFARTASYLMKTAMKLPPHILPTLDELKGGSKFPDASKSIGVYVPERHTNVGVYLPKHDHIDQKYKRHTEIESHSERPPRNLPQPSSLRGSERGQHQRPPRRRHRIGSRRQKPRFNIPFDPKRPLNFFSSLGARVSSVRKSFQRTKGRRQQRPPFNRSRPRSSPQNRDGSFNSQFRETFQEADNKHPYKFTAPDFNLPFDEVPPQATSESLLDKLEQTSPEISGSESNPAARSPYDNQHQNRKKSPRPPAKRPISIDNPAPAPNVPMFVKSLLAHTFLKDPDQYFKLLEDRKNKKKKKRRRIGDRGDRRRQRKRPMRAPVRAPPPPQQPSYQNDRPGNFEKNRFDPSDPFYSTRPLNVLLDEKKDHFTHGLYFEPTFADKFPVPKREHLEPFRDPFVTSAPFPDPLTTTTFSPSPQSDDYDYYNYLEDFKDEEAEGNLFSTQDYYTESKSKQVPRDSINLDVDYLLAPTQNSYLEQDQYSGANSVEPNPHRRNTICICCDESSSGLHRNHVYSRRSMQIEETNYDLNRLLNERAMLEQELDCSVQEPIEVVLVFESQKEQPKRPVRKTPKTYSTIPSAIANNNPSYGDYIEQVDPHTKYHLEDHSYRVQGHGSSSQDVFASNEVVDSAGYYDPTKLNFIFSTPSPLKKKYIEIRDRKALGQNPDTEALFSSRPFAEGDVFEPTKTFINYSDGVYFASSSDQVSVRTKMQSDQEQRSNKMVQLAQSDGQWQPKSLREVVLGRPEKNPH